MKSLHLALSCLSFAAAVVLTAPASANPIDVSFQTKQNITITAKLYLPAASPTLVPAVVLMHGCAGMYSFSDPSKGLALLFREWGTRLASAGYAALVVDSFSWRNMPQNQCGKGAGGVSEVTDRPHDAAGAAHFLKASYSGWIDQTKIALMGWSHGGSSTMAAMSSTMVASNDAPFKAAFAFYPGCGLYNAFGGISTSSYVPYAPLHILHAGIDPLYTEGHCDKRIQNAVKLGSSLMDMVVYPDAQHSFDNARTLDGTWTKADVDAKANAETFVMKSLQDYFK